VIKIEYDAIGFGKPHNVFTVRSSAGDKKIVEFPRFDQTMFWIYEDVSGERHKYTRVRIYKAKP
jgi:RIO-like serine/threonine protein kinase